MNYDKLISDCPSVNFNVPHRPYHIKYTLGDYILQYLPKTFEIITSSPIVHNSIIVEYAQAGIKDFFLPFSKKYLLENLNCSSAEVEQFLVAQSSYFAISFQPQEFKKLAKHASLPFVLDPYTTPRKGTNGVLEKVDEGNRSFARKKMNINYDPQKILLEMKLLKLATETRNPHLTHLHCAYEIEDRYYFILSPWCDLDLREFLIYKNVIPFWGQLTVENRLILISNMLACLASGLSALHNKKIKHLDLRPEKVLLDSQLLPVICDFEVSKEWNENSKSWNIQATRAYLPPEQMTGKVGRKGDIFSLGLIFVEIGLCYYGRKSLKSLIKSERFADITKDLDNFLKKKFPLLNNVVLDTWNMSLQKLIKTMLQELPENRPEASEVWEQSSEMVEFLGAKPHCVEVSPVESIPRELDEEDDDVEIILNESDALLCDY